MDEHPGDVYLSGVAVACALLWTVRHAWLLSLAAVPIAYTLGKKALQKSGAAESASTTLQPRFDAAKEKVSST